jgi:hypothetical protein
LTGRGGSCSFEQMPPQRKLTDFLIELATNQGTRKQYTRDRDKLLERRGLAGNSAFKDDATVEDMKSAVIAEDPNGVKSIEKWIIVASIPNDEFDQT